MKYCVDIYLYNLRYWELTSLLLIIWFILGIVIEFIFKDDESLQDMGKGGLAFEHRDIDDQKQSWSHRQKHKGC